MICRANSASDSNFTADLKGAAGRLNDGESRPVTLNTI